MKSDFTLAFNEIVETRDLPREKVLEALNQALVSAYRRDVRVIDAQRIEASIQPDGNPEILVEKEVVDDVINDHTEVAFHIAKELDPDIQLGDMLMVPVTTSNTFGRIAAQTAKQVILQHIREAERETLYGEYAERVGELVIGTVQSINQGTVTIDLGRAEAIMPAAHRVNNERYRQHDKVRVYIAEVKKTPRGPQIIVSRSHKNMLRRLLEYEVPEIYNGQIDIMSIAREAGHRSKVAVVARQDGLDAVGACVGMRGMRIQNIVKELNDEKIDIIEWDPDSARYIARALSPARVAKVFLEEEIDSIRTATVIVPEDQLSLAIGKEGQNARLAAKLTGWRIDIKSVMESASKAMDNIESQPLSRLLETHETLLADVYRILAKRAENRVITPEEYTAIRQFAELAENLLYQERQGTRTERREIIDTVRELVPPAAFNISLKELELADDIMRVIGRLENVGELWVRFMADEDGLQLMLQEGRAGDDAMEAIRYALDDLVLPEIEDDTELVLDPEIEALAEAEAVLAISEAEETVLPPEVVESITPVEEALTDEESQAHRRERGEQAPDYDSYMGFEEPDEEESALDDDPKAKKGKKKGKQKSRQLVYDEDMDQVVAKRRRKRGGVGFDEYDEFF